MVFFTCNACGQAIKKAQVDKHYQQQCRNCEVLSCMDCGKDFYGDDYKQHTQCISEDQKYGGKGYQAPQNANKGEAKQEQWLQRVREAVGAGNVSSNIKNLLDQIAEYPNIPRKKGKFENFVRNSLKVHNPKTIEQVWNVFSAATAKPDTSKSTQPLSKETGSDFANYLPNGDSKDNAMEQTVKEMAEEKKGKDKKSSKRSKSSESGQEITLSSTEGGKSKRKVKRASKHSASSENVHENASHGVEARTKEKTYKKKSKASESEDVAKDNVIVGEKVKAKKKKASKHKNESTYGSMSGDENSQSCPSEKGKQGDATLNKKDKKKTKHSKSDKSLTYNDGEVSFEFKLKAKKKENKEDDPPNPFTIEDNGKVNGSSSEKGTAKKSKKKKKREVVDSSKSNGVLTPSVNEVSLELKKKGKKSKKSRANELVADRDQSVQESGKKDVQDVGFTAEKKKRKHLKRKGDSTCDTAIVNKKAKLNVNGDMKKDKKKKKKKKPVASDKLETSYSNNETFPLVNGSLGDKKTKKKKKIRKQLSPVKGKDSNSSKGTHKHSDKHTTSEKQKKKKKKKEKKQLSKHLSPCKIDSSTSADESGKDIKAKSKKRTGKDKKDIELHNVELGLKKANSKTKKITPPDKPMSDTEGENTTQSSPKQNEKVNAAAHASKDSDMDASNGSINGKTKKKAKMSPTSKAKVMKGNKKASKESPGVVFRTKRSKSSNITSFELIGNEIVVHVRKNRTREHTDVQPGDQKAMPDSSAETPREKVKETSMKSSPRKIKKKQSSDEGDHGESGETNGGGDAVKEKKKKKKRKHEETDPQSGNESVASTEPSQKKVKKTSSELSESSPKKVKKSSKEKVKETSGETSAEKIKKKERKTSDESSAAKTKEPATELSTEAVKKKKKKKKLEVSKDEDQKLQEVEKKKKKKKRTFDETMSGPDDKSETSLTESSPKKVKKISVEPSTEKAKKKKKRNGSAGDQVSLSEMNGDGKAGKKKKAKSKRKEKVTGNEAEVITKMTAPSDIPGGDSPKRKKKKKNKESALTSDVMSKADTPCIDGGNKKKKKSKKEKQKPESEEGSPVKNGTISKLPDADVVKSVGLENGLGSVKIKKAKKGAKKSKEMDPNNNPMSFSTTSPIHKSVNIQTKSKSPNKKKKSHKKDKSKESSDMLGVAEAKAEVKKVKKTKKVKVK